MASEDTLIGNDFDVQIGDGNSPETFANICAAFDFAAFGEEKPLIDVTTFCDTARTYRNGLPDGVEIPLQCNYIRGDTQLQTLKSLYDSNTIRNFRIQTKDSPVEYFQFAATVRAWNTSGTIGEKSILTFTLKVTGGVDWVY
jgi:hypothetical protein